MSSLGFLPKMAFGPSLYAARTVLQAAFPQSLKVHECSVDALPSDGSDLGIELSLSRGNGEPFETSFRLVDGEHPRFLPTDGSDLVDGRMSLFDRIHFFLDLAAGGIPGAVVAGPVWVSSMLVRNRLNRLYGNHGPARDFLQGLSHYLGDEELSLFEKASKNLWREQSFYRRKPSPEDFRKTLSEALLVTLKSQNSYVWINRQGDRVGYGASVGNWIRLRPLEMELERDEISRLAWKNHVIDLPTSQEALRLTRMQANPSQYFTDPVV